MRLKIHSKIPHIFGSLQEPLLGRLCISDGLLSGEGLKWTEETSGRFTKYIIQDDY